MEIDSEKIKKHEAWLTYVVNEYFYWKEVREDINTSEDKRLQASKELLKIKDRFLNYLEENRELLPLLNEENLERIKRMLLNKI